jgi:hypothetical protein
MLCPERKKQQITRTRYTNFTPSGEHTMSAELKQKIQDLKGRLISLKEHL